MAGSADLLPDAVHHFGTDYLGFITDWHVRQLVGRTRISGVCLPVSQMSNDENVSE